MAIKKKSETINPSIPVEVEDEVVVNDTEIAEEFYIVPKRYGIVTDCPRLNVRKEPKLPSDIVCIVNNGAKVSIDLDESTDEFYKVCTETGFEGFCMKKFVSANI